MKATGIIRRVDDLGRIVIPKEIRRTLRIHEGDPMELCIHEGGVFLKKYSAMGEMIDYAKNFADSLFEETGHVALICDKDNIVAVAGTSKRDFLNKPIWNLANSSMEEMKILIGCQNDTPEEFDYKSQVVAPVICEGDVVGAIGLIAKEDIGLVEQKLVQTVAGFLAKQMRH